MSVAFGIVLVVLITVLAVALLIVIIGYLSQIFHKYGGMRKQAQDKPASPGIAPDPDEKSPPPSSDSPKPLQAKTD